MRRIANEQGIVDLMKESACGHVTLFFVRQFTAADNASQLIDGKTRVAITDTGYVKVLPPTGLVLPLDLVDEDDKYKGAAFIMGPTFPSNAPAANGKTLAHEIAHIVLSSDTTRTHVDEPVNVLSPSRSEETSLMRKRFTGNEVERLRSSANRFGKWISDSACPGGQP